MNRIAKNALLRLCREIRKRRASGWTSENRPIQTRVARHDRILARWPNAYAS
jgi:hypothetical protein